MASDISLSGDKGCGKSTIANALIQANKHYVKLSFATPLKVFLSSILEQDNDQEVVREAMYGDKDNTYVHFNPGMLDTSFQLAEMQANINIATTAAMFTKWAYEFNDSELVKGPVSGRRLLQVVGTEFFRNEVYSTFWTDLMHLKIQEAKKSSKTVIVDDTRFPDEFRLLEGLGFLMVKIQGTTDKNSNSTHDSETSLDGQSFDVVFLNDKSKGLEPINTFVQGII